MKKRLLLVAIVAGLLFLCVHADAALAEKDIMDHPSCKYCGMDRQQFAHSRMLIEYDDGSSVGVCSLHCAAMDLALHLGKSPVAVKVGDYFSRELIDAERASWVIGGEKPGVMTRRAKWAFGKPEDAERFMKENGGKPATFDEAMKAAYEDMYDDTRMIREKRKGKGAHQHEHKEHKHN
jgi:nitrous oxide reductase accessory protein NosL